jgi:hypothetical protein
MMRASFGRDVKEMEFTGALIYKIRRKNHRESNDQAGDDDKSTEDPLASVRLLITWGPGDRHKNNRYRFSVCARLIKHNNTITWDEDMIEKLHSMHCVRLKNGHNSRNTWVLDDGIVIMTRSHWKEENHAFEIIISGGANENGCMKPLRISSSI